MRYIKTLIKLNIFGFESANDYIDHPCIALVNHHEGFMTLFATSHTAKTLKIEINSL